MKKVFMFVVAFLILGSGMVEESQVALAGGGAPFSVLAFPGTSAQSCGTWQASGYGGLSTGKWVAIVSLIDATGKLVYIDTLAKIPANGIVSGALLHSPTQNPIHFVAFTLSTTTAKLSIIGDITMDDPCLSPSQSASVAIVSTANGTPRPVITLAGTQPLPLNGTGTPVTIPAQPPYANFGCSSTGFGGVFLVAQAPYIRATVNMSSDSGPVLLGSGTVALSGVSYHLSITYPPQAPGTPLILTIGQWDGTKYVGPSTQLTGDCVGPTPTYSRPVATTAPPTPTVATSPAPMPTTGAPISYGIQQVYVPAGCFMMGSDGAIGTLDYYPDEQPEHQVCITKSYWLDEFDVTNAAFDAFAKAGGYTNDNLWSKDGLNWKQSNNITGPSNKDYYNSDCSRYSSAPNQPRVCVGYYEAEAYAKWRTCRLPTEAEWEYAARGPKASIYPWGDTFDLSDYQNKANMDGRIDKTTVVDAYPLGKSWVGAYDMLGNVYQWVADLWNPNYYTYRIQNDPTGPTSGQLRVIRGTPWYNPKNVRIHSSLRSASSPDRIVSIGFRVACSAPNPAPPSTATPTYVVPVPTLDHPPMLPNTPAPSETVTPTVPPTAIADNGTTDLGTVSIPAGLTQSVSVTALKGWDSQDDKSGVDWSWEGAPTGMAITDMSMPAPFERVFYLTPSATTAIGTYGLTLHAANRTKQWIMQLVMNVTDCRETFQPGTYTLNAASNAASTHFGYGGPDSWRAGLGDQRWFTFCASPQKRQLTLTLLSAAGKTDKLGEGYDFVPDSISFLRYASWPLPPLVTNPLTFLTNDPLTGDLAPENAKVFTWTIQPGAYVIFFESNHWGSMPDPSATVTYSASLS